MNLCISQASYSILHLGLTPSYDLGCALSLWWHHSGKNDGCLEIQGQKSERVRLVTLLEKKGEKKVAVSMRKLIISIDGLHLASLFAIFDEICARVHHWLRAVRSAYTYSLQHCLSSNMMTLSAIHLLELPGAMTRSNRGIFWNVLF